VRRAPIVITATVVGLIGVLEFHSRPAAVSVGTLPAAGAVGATAAASPTGTAPSRRSAGTAAPPKSGSTRQPTGTRTAVGPQVNYSWGVLSVKVTVSGTKITKVGIGTLDDGGNPRSQYIDQQSIPVLEQETMQAQNANIQGVSGASYTSAGFQQSLQGALHQLGLQ
jgi:uncharacterized protein with FMN-binding domain